MTEPHSEGAPAAHTLRSATRLSRRWVVLSVLIALAFVSGVGASQEDATGPGEVVASFDTVAIEDLPLHTDRADDDASGDSGELASGLHWPAIDDARGELGSGLGAEVGGEPESAPLIVVTKGELAAGQSLGGELAKRGIDAGIVHLIAARVRPLLDFRYARPGHRYRLALDADGNLIDFRYSTSIEKSVYLFWDGREYVVRRDEAQLQTRVANLAGLVETSLYDAVRSLGEDPQLADDFSMIFAWDIDFTRNVKSGDAFRVLYERLFIVDDDGEEVYVRPGRILAARYQGAVGEHSAVYFETKAGRGSYFRPNGSSIEGAFLVAPLRYNRITSTFTNARRHPILNVTRRHPGIDYAAAEGTQLWSIADGTVVFSGWAGASGNLVKVRHANGYVSHYAHLARFAAGLVVGKRVHQKEVIGYVGHTGLATGSHVCFRVTKNGRYVNPMAIRSPSTHPTIAAEQQAGFNQIRDQLLASLDSGLLAAQDEAL